MKTNYLVERVVKPARGKCDVYRWIVLATSKEQAIEFAKAESYHAQNGRWWACDIKDPVWSIATLGEWEKDTATRQKVMERA